MGYVTAKKQEIMGNVIPETTESHKMSQLTQLPRVDTKHLMERACKCTTKATERRRKAAKSSREDPKTDTSSSVQ